MTIRLLSLWQIMAFDPQTEVSAYDRQNPLFLVKGVGESHPLQTSLVPAAYEDLQDAYVRLMDGAAGDAIFPYQEGEKENAGTFL